MCGEERQAEPEVQFEKGKGERGNGKMASGRRTIKTESSTSLDTGVKKHRFGEFFAGTALINKQKTKNKGPYQIETN